MTEWAFCDLGIAELLLEIDPQNIASVTVAEKCGFEPADHRQTGEQGAHSDGKLVFVARKRQSGPTADAASRT